MKNNKPLVSIFMMAYNHENYIKQAIESVLLQNVTFTYEIVVGEDCSTDRTRSIILKYKKNLPDKFKLILHEENVGAVKNQIEVFRNCTGKYIAMLEGDDYWTDPYKLQKQVEVLEKRQDTVMVFSNRSIIDQEGVLINDDAVPEDYKKDLSPEQIIGSYTPPTQTVVFRREFLDDRVLKKLSEVFNGDTLLFWYIAQFGTTAFLNENTAVYRVTGKGAYSELDYMNKLQKRIKTLDVIQQTLKTRYIKHIKKSKLIDYQRLSVIYFRNGNFRYGLGSMIKIGKVNPIYIIKTFRLLVKSILFGKTITD